MSWDLALSEHGDLVFAGNRDFAGVSGIDLIEQRIKTRLKIQRGSWVYDEDETLGSNLQQVTSMRSDHVETAAKGFVLDALQPMSEINVTDVQIDFSSHEITVSVFYIVSEGDQTDPEIHELEASVPVVPIAGSTATTEE